MKNLLKFLGIVVLVSAIGFSMSSCASSPPRGSEVSTLAPDASSAVVYFLQPSRMHGGGDIIIWDGENPVGKIPGGLYRNVAYRARPGTHYFLANRFNWSHVRVDVRANNTYYIRLNWAPNPVPFARNAFVILEVMSQEDGLAQFNRNQRSIAFSDAWREEYKNSLSQAYLGQLNENIAAARAARN